MVSSMVLNKRLECPYLVGGPIVELAWSMVLVEAATVVARRAERRTLQRPASTHQDGDPWFLHRSGQECHLVYLKMTPLITEGFPAPQAHQHIQRLIQYAGA